MSTEVSLHLLGPDTAAALDGAKSFDHPLDPSQLAAFVSDPGHLLVFASAGPRVVGFASGTILLHPDKPPALFVNEVSVDEDVRRQGIGRALCTELFRIARARGARSIWLATEAENAPARALYASLGARSTEGVVVYDWDGAMDA